jgi:hypothetical protein
VHVIKSETLRIAVKKEAEQIAGLL